MIKTLQIANIASYSSTPQTFGELKAINYVYGPNGSGKTTISRIIAHPENYPSCPVVWDKGQRLMPMVYNRDFVELTFKPSVEIQGIFTLGTGDDDILEQIQAKKNLLETLNGKINSLAENLNGENGVIAQLNATDKDLADYCWEQIKATYDETFPAIFSGVNASKAKLAQRVQDHFHPNNSSIRTREELEAEAKVVFDDQSTKLNRLLEIDFSPVMESLNSPIFGQAIIGSAEVDISDLISTLGISDWVKQGWSYLGKTQGKCPFCQQLLPENIEDKFRSYFDESFRKNMSALEQCADGCCNALHSITVAMDSVLSASNPLLDTPSFLTVKKQFESKIEVVQTRLDLKRNEPSRIISMPDFNEEITTARDLLAQANTKTDAHNTLLDNRKASKGRLVEEIWDYIITTHETNLSAWIAKKHNLEKAKKGLEEKISAQKRERENVQKELHELEKKRTSVHPTIESINAILRTFGFNSFKLAAASETTYLLQRPNGTSVGETLSEGERSFISFLYFYHLLKGGMTAETVNSNRIAVFDDPVSSMDSDVLFVVSTLIRRCIEDVRNGVGNIKQVIVLTHNVYFHKEVTFSPHRNNGRLRDETFWLVKKTDNSSLLLQSGDNPIKTSYELLWEEIKYPGTSLISLQNTMRRILEYYFRILGGWKDWMLDSWFEGVELSVCQSLLSWVNDGSHFPDDDLHYRISLTTADMYKKVFKLIFEKTGHIEHYKMMMHHDNEDV